MEIKKAIITAAGFGSRFLPITKSFPKELLPVVDKPIIHYLVEECAEAGIEEVIIVASPSEINTFENYFYGRATDIRTLMIRQGKLERWSKVEKVFDLPLITVLPEDRRLSYGNGRPILSAKDLVVNEDAFVVMFGDDMVISDISATKQLKDHYLQSPSDALLGVQEVSYDQLNRYGILKLKDNDPNTVERVIEKPEPEDAPSSLASYGRFILTPKVFDYLKEDSIGKDNEIWLQDANDKLAQNGKVAYKIIDGNWMTTGDPLRYMQAQILYAMKNNSMKDYLVNFMKDIVEKETDQ